jgi:hypothetical protein
MIKIETEKVLKYGQLAYKIMAVSALPFHCLPSDYVLGAPSCYLNVAGELVISCDHKIQRIGTGQILSKSVFETSLIPVLAACGERLAVINSQIRKANWFGTQTFEI